MLRTLLCLTVFSTTACAGGPPSRGPLGVYAARQLPVEKEPVGGDSSPPWPWLDPEQLKPDTGVQGEEELLGWLVSGDSAQRAEAQIRLLPLGEALLPRLEALALGARDDEARSGLLEFLQVLTARRVHPDGLGRYPALSALVEKSVARGQGLVAFWEVEPPARQLIEELPVSQCGVGPQPESKLLLEGQKLQELRDKLGSLGGLALPGVERLMASHSATSRLQGIVLAAALGLRPSAATLERLRKDPDEVELDARYAESFFTPSPNGLLRTKVSISKRATLLVQGLGTSWREPRKDDDPAALRAEDGIIEWFNVVRRPAANDAMYALGLEPGDLINGLRGGGAWEATDAQMYWNRARPLWRLWWRTVGPRPATYQREHWFALTNSARGVQIRSAPGSSGKTVLRVASTPGVEAELLSFPPGGKKPVVLQRGTLPLAHSSKEPVPSAGIRLRVGEEWVDSGPFFAPREGEQMTVWVHPELLRRYLKERQAGR